MTFAKRSNFKAGFFSEEARLVEEYLKGSCNVLVIGAGNGREARPICLDGHHIVCMDIGAFYLHCGKAYFEKEGIYDIRFVQADAADLPFRTGCFKFVFCSIYSALGNKRFDLMHNIHRIMHHEGLMLHSCCTPLYQKSYPPSATRGFVWIKSNRQLEEEVLSCGFEVIESKVDSVRPEYRFSMLKKAEKKA